MIFTTETFYKSAQYLGFRDVVISERQNPKDKINYCEHCRKPIVNDYDLILHHKEELTNENVNDYSISLNQKMVEIICFKCHNKHHSRFGYETRKRVYLVYGAPCSGKTTWIKEVAQPNDLIVDLDSIFEMISSSGRYIKSNRLKSVAFDIRDKLLEIIKYRSGKWQNAYVIGGYPVYMERKRLADRINAEEVFINTDKEKCLERLYSVKDNRNKDEWEKYINEWFEKYQT